MFYLFQRYQERLVLHIIEALDIKEKINWFGDKSFNPLPNFFSNDGLTIFLQQELLLLLKMSMESVLK